MNHKELLLSKRWIIKNEDREQYYRIKDDIKNLKKVFQDTLGYSLISHQNFIKLDKVPGKAEPWMGITDFRFIEEYQMLCYVLIFLEDKEPEEQFILSYLTEFIQLKFNANEEYWLKFSHRKMFVNVIKFCLKEKLFLQDDGNMEQFMQNENIEVLFENTGLSRYFMRNFVSNIFEYQQPQDFMSAEWVGLEEDRGIVRKQRIYRRLMLSCGIYKEDQDQDDFSFIRNYRKRIQNDFQNICPCEIQVYKSSAFLILDDSVKIGRLFPKSHAMDELVVLVMTSIRKQIKKVNLKKDEDEIVELSQERLKSFIKKVLQDNEKYLPMTYRQKNKESLLQDVYQYLLHLGFATEKQNQVMLYPVIGKLMGSYGEE